MDGHNEITEIDNAAIAYDIARKAKNNYHKQLLAKRHNEFVANMGCGQCHGHGIILTWSTLDGPGWNEYGPCPNVFCTAKQTGPDKSTTNPRYEKPIRTESLLETDEEKLAYKNLVDSVNNSDIALRNARDKWTPSKGKRIEVIRTSKGADKGDQGIVFWTGTTYYGNVATNKVGFKTDDGITCWTTDKSCKVINPIPIVSDRNGKDINCTIKRESDKAYLINANGKECWIPKSQAIKIDNGLNLPAWLISKNGLA